MAGGSQPLSAEAPSSVPLMARGQTVRLSGTSPWEAGKPRSGLCLLKPQEYIS